jgi:hypothetical protein
MVRITPALAGGAREILHQYMEALRAGDKLEYANEQKDD